MIRYAELYSEKDKQRVTEGRFTANNLNNCNNIGKFLSRFAASVDFGRYDLALAIDKKASGKFGEEWSLIKQEYNITLELMQNISA